MVNWNALQAAGAAKKEGKNPGNVLPRYMAAGSWRASLSKGGAKKGR